MDISKAKRVIELSSPDSRKKMIITLWENDRISSCVEEEKRQVCEACQGDAELCQNYIEHLIDRGYQATEIELGELEIEESLPRFLEDREVKEE